MQLCRISKITLFLIMTPFLVLSRSAEVRAEAPVKVAVLPFTVNAPSNMAYLRDGVRDMLASRLAWKNKVQVVDRATTDEMVKGAKSALSDNEAVKLGQSLRADYVLSGSITAIGQAVSIDAVMLPVQGATEPMRFSKHSDNLDELVPTVNQFAQEINQKLFARPADQTDVTSSAQAGEPSFSNRNPELLIPMGASGDKASPFNPNFIEVTPEGSISNSGMWKSQTILEGVVSMDVGDLDGDKRPEVVTVSNNKLTVYRREANALRAIAVYNAAKLDKFIYVALADVNRDGKDEIYLTDMHQYNDPRGSNSGESISSGQTESKEPTSFALTLVNGKLQVASQPAPYFLNAIAMTGRGKVLIGQKPGQDETFDSTAYEMTLRGDQLIPAAPMSLPRRCNVFNFVRADLNGDKADEYVAIDNDSELLIMDSAGSPLSKSSKHFGATTNYILGKVHDLRYNQVDYYYIPSPIAVYDANKDGKPEIIVNCSSDYSGMMPEGLKYYDRGQVVSLSWDQMGFVENWKTREINGMVTAVRIADLNNDGTPELVIALVMSKDLTKLWDSKSVIYTYDLNIAAAQEAAKKRQAE
ncbi:MAG: FG-GAP-like repeat-containing protein [Syntrophobacteraceae bacterium]